MEKVKDVFRAAGRFSAGTVLSRFSGLIRDVAIAYAFGVDAAIGGFMVAFRFANLLRRLLGEGILQTGFVPVYEKLKKESPKTGAQIYRDMLWSLLLLTLLVSFLTILFIQGIQPFFNGGWQEILYLTQIMVFSLLWISLFGLDAALLQAEKKTFWAGFAPSLFNLGMFAFTFGAGFQKHPMQFLSFGVVVSFMLQWLVAFFQAKNCLKGQLSLKEWFSPSVFSEDVKRAFSAIGFGIIGIGAGQLNSALDAIFARLADPSGPAFLWYSIRLYQLPIALVGIALSSALLPSLVRRCLNKPEEESNFFSHILEKGLELIVVCAFALGSFAQSGVNLLFGHGNFGSFEVKQTVLCLWAYGVGFVPAALVLLLAQKHYAKRSFKIPVRASLLSIAFHLVINMILVFGFKLGAISVALSTSGGALLNCYLLCRGESIVFKWPISTIGVSLAAMLCCLFVDAFFGIPKTSSLQLLHLLINASLFGAIAGFYLLKKWRSVELEEV